MIEEAPILQIEAACKRYGDITALGQTDLSAAPGDLIAVHGPSGSGKSTLLQIAGALLKPDGGKVQIGGQEPYLLSPNRRSRFRLEHIGFVFQDSNLLPYLSLAENIRTPTLSGASPDPERAESLLEHFGLSHRRRHRPAKLSAGERQRVALARALLLRPKLLLADEPTGNLDPDNTELVLGYLEEYAAAGNAVIIATHEQQAIDRSNRCHPLK
ncbi:MAG: ABC transporter ATP-binding protein [Verrucomicrobiales bacterium]